MTASVRVARKRESAGLAVARARWRFFREFLKHPVMIGSIWPSSSALIERMLAPVDWQQTSVFVEYGPGVGVFTRAVLERLRPDATLVAIDTNPDFIDFLRAEIADPRLVAVVGSAADVGEILARHGTGCADHVLSGLPFSTLPAGVGARIVAETAACLRPGGMFLVYQLSAAVKALLVDRFGDIAEAVEWRNLPPMRLYWARRGQVSADGERNGR